MTGPAPLPPLTMIPDSLRSLRDYERQAEAHMPAASWRHVQSGAGAETTLAANRAQFDRHRLVPRALADMRGATTGLDLFGLRHAAPILLAPVAYHRLAHPDGELATVSAATALETTMVVSTLSSVPLEDIAARARAVASELAMAPPPLWFQLYLQPDRGHTAELVRRAEAAGYQVLVFTVDAGVKRSGFALPPGVDAANLRGMPVLSQSASVAGGRMIFGTALLDAAPTWESLDWLRGITRLPIVVKGLLSPADARMAAGRGADGIIVSNHGGRVLDGLATPLDVLPAMAEAVDGKVPLLLDSGVREATDVLKALALGARAVLIGRPQIHALAVAGMQGVAHALHILRTELELAMAQVGCPSLAAIARGDLLMGSGSNA
ncbi:alpha-hydroxy acid oxidase [Novosphingobium album (ex Liu et al. 2023)]|uniref:Alpha-hydroxy acid oxidase n=1 Tax=Novosphingobium album (ex Liu et al. 2023) TaxID=3031130 RepID=A0ABT5WN77_9SPHN|nr:alpha-hydroxy acid oxidase [Novosphingobium album (ex Liu et al. 2023)]MDE8651501.1 alpha-hydroxy acid oxidase [Novosphingobium album (ex Liu et al. 2023)]